MSNYETLFLEALKASLTNKTVTWTEPISSEEWQDIFVLSEAQKVLPLIFHAVSACPAASSIPPELFARLKERTKALIFGQAQKTIEFLQLYSRFSARGIRPLVVKGAVCRELYPIPELRISTDEDILVSASEFTQSVDLMADCGYTALREISDMDNADEIGFTKPNGASYIELHKVLFAKDSMAYGEFNKYFSDCFENAVSLNVQGVVIDTMNSSMHLFYLICHAFKHFLHSGFGLRQVCDIVMFAERYGEEIDWQKLLVQCCEIHADRFAAALFKIGKKYLTFDFVKACYPKQWQEIDIDEEELLIDLLQSGIYGGSTMSRRHSAKMTLEAAASMKNEKRVGNTVIRTAFPPAKDLEGRFPYLKGKPYLLPLAWTSRILKYQKETKRMDNNSAAETIKIGKERIRLMKKYGIIE